MKDSSISLLRKKLIHRSLNRGCKEVCIILRYFALNYLDKFSFSELIEYEKIINLDDLELYYSLIRKPNHVQNLNSKVLNLIISVVNRYSLN